MIFLQASQEPSGWTTYAFFGAMLLVFYFFMIRPQNKKRKKLEELRSNLKKGDSVQTIGGIHGKVAEVSDTTIILQVEGGVKLKVEKTAVSLDGSTQLTDETAGNAAISGAGK
jgi:preprotein translocase subunit YajC